MGQAARPAGGAQLWCRRGGEGWSERDAGRDEEGGEEPDDEVERRPDPGVVEEPVVAGPHHQGGGLLADGGVKQ